MKRSNFTDEQILAIVKEGEAEPEGRPSVPDARHHRADALALESEFGGMELSEMQNNPFDIPIQFKSS